MNILIIGEPSENLILLIKRSNYTEKIYTALNSGETEFPNITYRNFDELIQKALALKIDIAVNLDKTLIASGIAEFFEKSKINLISVNKKWLNLETSRLSAKKLLDYYKINNPQIIRIPISFPVILKTDLPGNDYKISDMHELVEKMEKIRNETKFFEEFMPEASFKLYTVWDKRNVKFFRRTKKLTEVQKDRLDLLETKLNFMLSDENADFTGVFGINLIWHKNDWYAGDFDMCPELPAEFLEGTDFIFLLNSAIYQKLNEI